MSKEAIIGLYDEVVKIRQLLEMIFRENLERELQGILTTRQRKVIWAMSDGFTETKTIAKKIGISQRSVQVVLKDLKEANLLDTLKRGYPKRRFDHVPPKWIPKGKGSEP